MSGKSLISSNRKLGVSSGGVLQLDYMKQWSQPLSKTQGTEPGRILFWPWQQTGEDLSVFHLAAFRISQTTGVLGTEALLRVLCYRLLDQMPEQGLHELFEVMKEIFEFYHARIENQTLSLPEPRKVKAKLGDATIRPVFPVVENEE